MCALWLSEPTCRVCLASDREMYCLANTPLEETYERVTSGTLVVEGRPCCVCGVCLSVLRRCRRFIDSAREANDALDRWIRNHPNTDTFKLTERPLFSLTQRATELIDIMDQSIGKSGVKQESYMAENEDFKMNYQNGGTPHNENNILTEAIKVEVTSDDRNDYTHVSNDETDKTQMSGNIESHSSIHFKRVNIQEEMVKVENDNQMLDDVICDSPKPSDNVGGETAPGTSNIRSLQSRKRVKLNDDTKNGPALKKRRPITSEHRRRNTDPAAALHKEGKMFSCPECSYKTAYKSLIKEHLMIHPGEKPFKCDKCDYKCRQKSRMYQHLRTHDTKHFMCNKCDYESNVMKYLRQHLMTHTGEKPFSCDKCDYKSSNITNLKRHSKIHTGEKPFACTMCDYKCIQKTSLKQHMMTHSNKPSVCNICQFKCKSECSLMLHLSTHKDRKPFACDKCNYKCFRIDQLKNHSFTHTGEKPFRCDKCDYKCIQKVSLKRHSMIHSGEKPFRCDSCGYKCIQKIHLTQHLRIHTGEKPFACDKCDYKSKDIGNYKRHLIQHTDERKFACNLCDYRARQRGTLNQHLRTHTGEKPFMCDKCYYKCCDKRHLIKHMMKAHATCI